MVRLGGAADRTLLECTRRLIAFRREHRVFRRRRWFQGRPIHGSGTTDVAWFRPDGRPMSEEDWTTAFAKSFAVFLDGHGIPSPGPQGERLLDDSFLLLFNAHHEPCPFTLPGPDFGRHWVAVLDTAESLPEERGEPVAAGAPVKVEARALTVFRRMD